MVTSRSLLCSACTVGWIARVNRKRRERAARSYFLEAIADTIERLDHIELDVACPELYAQPLDVAVDGSVVDIHLIVVGCIHQGVAVFTTPGLLASACKMRNSVTVSVISSFFQVQACRSGSIRSWPRSKTLLSASFGTMPSLGEARRRTTLTRSARRRCEKGLRMKSSAPIFRPNNSSICSSFEVRKITGRSDFCRSRRNISMP